MATRKCLFLLVLFIPISSLLAAQQPADNLRQLEQQVQKMKEQVIKHKIKLRQLEEAVLFGEITETTALIHFKNEADGYFEFQEGLFYLNGKLLTKINKQDLTNHEGPMALFDREIPPGDHELKLKLTFSGKKKGPFTYVKDYRFTVDSGRTFFIEQGNTKAIEIVVFDRGPFKTKLKDRLAVTFNITTGS